MPSTLRVKSPSGALLAEVPAAVEPAAIAGQGYRLAFVDDFEGTQLDRTVWSNMPWYVWEPTAYDVADSVLSIHPPNGRSELISLGPRAASAPHYPYALTFHEGYFEARMSYGPMDLRFTPAFWLWGVDRAQLHPTVVCSPPTLQPEWDLAEIFNIQDPPGTFHAGVHSNTLSECGVTDVVGQLWKGGVNMTGWHTYGGLWADGKLRSYVDGVECAVFDVPSSFTQRMALTLSQSYQPGATTRFDWVRVWQK